MNLKEAKPASAGQQWLQTGGGKTKSAAIQIPAVELPKGGGALKGIDEKFSVNAANGTAALAVPLPFTPGRGVTPALTLSYNSGNGNGVFGLGWQLDTPAIRRKTEGELPQYGDSDDTDTFLYAGADDLVPELAKRADGSFLTDAAGNYRIREQEAPGGFTIRFYKPRIEGTFARIERWRPDDGSAPKWRVISPDNTTTLFGWTEAARIADPNDTTRVVEWLPEFVFDDKGNCAHYQYKAEDEAGIDLTLLSNRSRVRAGRITYTNRYLYSVWHGNKTPFTGFGTPFPAASDYLFSTLFDYGEYSAEPPCRPVGPWPFRTDAFSVYKAGFEVRTTRLCRRILFFHHFTGSGEYDGLVRSVDLQYADVPNQDFSLLGSITQTGYALKPDGGYTRKQLPPLTFSYETHHWNRTVCEINAADLPHTPCGLDESSYQFTDLYNEGLAGILTEQGGSWFYQRNQGGGRFAAAEIVGSRPSFNGLGAQLQFSDLNADGGKQLVCFAGEPRGFFELDEQEQWQPFQNFATLPNINFNDPNTRMLDLDGDGRPELVIAAGSLFTWYPSEGRNGYAAARQTTQASEAEGPHLIFADGSESVYLADMSGDGLTDIVQIRNGVVCYWPNLGYGRFGARVTMDHAPVFDHPDAFDPSCLRLADIDGTGTTDLIYLGKNKFTCWQNRSGNRFSETPFEMPAFPEIHTQNKVTVTDLLGNGTACIVWSGTLEKDAGAPLRYIDLMQGRKPYLLTGYQNNQGKEVHFEYQPSTRYYLQDRTAGRPWATKLHFPVHCISRTTTEDRISGYRFVSTYQYHHGYYDHLEKEFRGFGMVEQTDTESFERWALGANVLADASLHQDPVVSKNWFHTGAFAGRERIVDQFAEEYWYAELESTGVAVTHAEAPLSDARMVPAPGMDSGIIDGLSAQEWREALRACKGMQLRSELFAQDAARHGNTATARHRAALPYTVSAHNCLIELLQPKGPNRYAVFVVKESEAITYHYERNPADPRVMHKLNISMDDYGNVLESVSVAYPRNAAHTSLPAAVQAAQGRPVILFTQNRYTNDAVDAHRYRLRQLSETQTYELKGVARNGPYHQPDDFRDILSGANSDTAAYHEKDRAPASGRPLKRLIEQVQSLFYNNDLTGPLPLHHLESLGLPYEQLQLAYTPVLLDQIFAGRATESLRAEGGFVLGNGNSNWWVRSGKAVYLLEGEHAADAQSRFFKPLAYTDPCGATTKIRYYGSHYLLQQETNDPYGNTTRITVFDFRTLKPRVLQDLNGNYSSVLTDELGMVKVLAVLGKGTEADNLTGHTDSTDAVETATSNAFFTAASSTQVQALAKDLLRGATTRFVYDLNAYADRRQPIAVAAISREVHARQLPDAPVQIALEYSNGLGEVVMKKAQAEPGPAKTANIQIDGTVAVTTTDTGTGLRWTATGRTVRNNKGNAVMQYEPYFSATHRFEAAPELVAAGVTPLLYYDAVGRLVTTLLPDGTFVENSFDAWQHTTADANDTAPASVWYQRRAGRQINAALTAAGKDPLKEAEAARQSAAHGGTPEVQHMDVLGRVMLVVQHNKDLATGNDLFFRTETKRDAEGNLLAVTDARGNLVTHYAYDMLGNLVYQHSMDAGKRWLLLNNMGKPLRTWDERNHEFRYRYDLLQRPIESRVMGGDGTLPLDHIFDRVVYGENLLEAGRANEVALQQRNVLGQPVARYDSGGLVETPAYDFKGQPVTTTRRLFARYKEVVNWTDSNLTADLEPRAFTFATETDALGRIARQVAPDGSIITPFYNKGGLLNQELVAHPGAAAPTPYIKDIAYNEKGQRSRVVYGNGVRTLFYYDAETFRLVRVETRRQNGDTIQDWRYTYDAVGNITHIEDRNIPRQFFNNWQTAGTAAYTYDALYRLVTASGREHDAILPFGQSDNWQDAPYLHHLQYGDPMAARPYTQHFRYDAVGNLVQLKHEAPGNHWIRDYTYEAVNNRLQTTTVAGEVYTYPHQAQHGYITALPHLEDLGWNFKEELVRSVRQRRLDGGTPETTYYQYDGSGQRLRKITELTAAPGATPATKEERVYLAGYEWYRQHSGASAGLERTSLSLMDGSHRFVMIDTRNSVDDGTDQQLVRYQHHNHLGSAALELDANAAVISYEEYHPYGTTAYQARNKAIKAAAKRYRYTGMERDEETGLSYHSARYYLPWLGRWLSSDPIGIMGGVNSYCYASSNPVKLIDRTGLQAQEEEPSNWNRFTGVLGVIGGGIEAFAGGSLFAAGVATSEIGVGIPVAIGGGAVFLHGIDTIQARARQVYTGVNTDSLTSSGLQSAGMTRGQANLTDAGIGIVGTLGSGAVSRLPALAASTRPAGALVHLTTTESATAINTSSTLGRGGSTLYAATPSLAQASPAVVTLRTGLLPAQATTAVEISPAAAQAFRSPALIGPTTAWQRASGAYFSSGSGTLNLSTGVFTRTGAPLNQYFFYGLDGVLTPALNLAATTSSPLPSSAEASTTTTSPRSGTATRRPPASVPTAVAPDPTNPLNYPDYAAFEAANPGPYASGYLMERWANTHGWVSTASHP